MYELEFTAHTAREEKELDGNERVFVDKALKRIKERGMQAGQPLQGELKHCRKLKNQKMGLRVIFRQLDDKIEVIQIVAIGKRSDAEVYKNAIERLKEDE
ncbi:type II toxin-antitoxin system RelE family toxin [Salinicoccus sp. CNSTN-B1]